MDNDSQACPPSLYLNLPYEFESDRNYELGVFAALSQTDTSFQRVTEQGALPHPFHSNNLLIDCSDMPTIHVLAKDMAVRFLRIRYIF